MIHTSKTCETREIGKGEMLRTLFKEHGFYLKVSKDFDVRCNVTDLNFREAVLGAL